MATDRNTASLSTRLRLTQSTEESTGAAVYGLVVTGAVLAASPGTSAAAVEAQVLLTLLVYWIAERYARLVAQRIHDGHRPAWHQVWHQLVSGWQIVTASALPGATLVVLRLLGADVSTAITGALACTTALLFLTGWEMGRHGQLSGRERLVSGLVSAALGAVMSALKVALH